MFFPNTHLEASWIAIPDGSGKYEARHLVLKAEVIWSVWAAC